MKLLALAIRCASVLYAATLWFSSSDAAPPYEHTSAQGKYRIISMPDISGEFEVTADLAFAVVCADNTFRVHSVNEGKVLDAALNQTSDQWKVVGQELVLCEPDGWTHYALPGLEKKQTYPYPPADGKWNGTQALARGWFSCGYIFEDDHQKIVATLRHPYGQVIDTAQFTNYDRRRIDTCIPGRFSFTPKSLWIDAYDEIPMIAPGSPKYRCGINWFTAFGDLQNAGQSGRKLGVYVEFVGPHFQKIEYFNRLHWWGGVPMVLEENADVAHWQKTILPQLAKIACPTSIEPSTGDVQSHTQLLSDLNDVPFEQIDELFEKYLQVTAPEFEKIAGRKPTMIPMAFVLSFSDRNSTSSQLFWTELTKEQIMARFMGGRRYQDAQAARLAAENAKGAMINEHKRLAEQIRQENTRFAQRKFAPFKANFKTYACYAAMMGVSLLVSCVCLGFLIRRKPQIETNSSTFET